MQSSLIASIVVGLLTLIGCMTAPDPVVTVLVGTSLIVGLLALWPKSGIPVLLLPFVLQWISVATKPIESAVTGVPLIDLSELGADLTSSAIFGSVALMALAVGMYAGMAGSDRSVLSRLQGDVANWTSREMLTVGLGLVIGGHLATAGAYFVNGLSEIMLALSNATYCGLFVLVYFTLRTGRLAWAVGAIALLEIGFGMTGFFGTFKTTLFTLGLAVMCAQHRFKPQTVIAVGLILVPALFLSVFWSSVKRDYREFMNNGSETQSVQQPMSARLDFLNGRLQTFDRDKFNDGFITLLDRVSYIDFLAATLDYVPANIPHENGRRTFAAVTHIFTPRIIFTSKPPLESDTIVTAKYTGLVFTNTTYASISIGYLGEAYIDFGWYGACVFMLIYGAIIGFLVRVILRYEKISMILNAGLAAMVVIPICYFEEALIKAVGGATATVIAAFLLQRFVLPSVMKSLMASRSRIGIPILADRVHR